jgi:hypothetical protein
LFRHKKATRRWLFCDLKKRITSFRQQVQQQVRRVQRLHQQQVRVQKRQQPVRVQQREPVRVQERGLLFCHKQPKRRPSGRPRGLIFSC